MKNKQHKYILKAFIESKVPVVIQRCAPELIDIDSVIGGYCARMLTRSNIIELPLGHIITETDKKTFSELINQSNGVEKNELLVYYRLAILVESILIQYQQ
jgi:hypothetical protein